MSKNKKFLVTTLCLVCVVASVFVIKSVPTKNKNNNYYSCYDYIIDTMAEPEYWNEEYIPHYGYELYDEIAKEKMMNGSGFKYDEINDKFYRGYYSRLVYDFSNNKAYNEVINYFDMFDPKDNRESSYSNVVTYDFGNREMVYYNQKTNIEEYSSRAIIEDHKNVFNEDGTYKLVPYSTWFDNEFDFDFDNMKMFILDYAYILASPVYNIEKSMNRYEKKFSSAGCPLLNQPTGTMEKYKNKQAHPVLDEVSKTKINAPWELDNFKWNFLESDLNWIDDLSVLNVENQPETKIGNDQIIPMDHYGIDADRSPLYVSFVKKDYDESVSMSENGSYPEVMGAFVQYVLAPQYKEIYGYDAVYFYDYQKAIASGNYDPSKTVTPTYDEFKNGIFNFPENTIEGQTLRIEKDKQIATFINNPLFESAYVDCYEELIADYFATYNENAKWLYSDDYLINFLSLYSKTYQNHLGLR